MRQRVTMAVVAFVLAVTTAAFAQTPDFSGTWTLDQEASQMAGGVGGRGMMTGPITVKHTGSTVTVERSVGENKMTSTYKIDGETTNTMRGRGGESVEAKSTAKWEGKKLVINTKRDMGGNTVEITQTWTLSGDTLTIESTGGRGPSKLVYKKTT